MTTAIKFNLHNVTNGTHKARVSYSKQTYQGVTTVTLYAKTFPCGDALREIFGADVYSNYTDTQSDLFDQGSVTIGEKHPLFAAACAAAERRASKPRARRTSTPAAVEVHSDEVNTARTSRTVSAICGKVGAVVIVYPWGVTVAIVGKTRFGKSFRSLAAAQREYRSPEVLAILAHVATTKPRITVRAEAVAV